LNKAKELFSNAARKGFVSSKLIVAELFAIHEPEHFVWSARAAKKGRNGTEKKKQKKFSLIFLNEDTKLLENIKYAMQIFGEGVGSARVVFVIGRELKGHIDEKNKKIFHKVLLFFDFAPLNQAVKFYEFQVFEYRTAIDVWSVIGKRLNVVKDVRILIAKLVWKSRKDAKYKMN
jgi:hypothetical protein